MRKASPWITLVKGLFYGLAILALLFPFAGLVLDPGDRNHLARFLLFPIVAAVLVVTGKLIATALHALLIYIESPGQGTLSLDLEVEREVRDRFSPHSPGCDKNAIRAERREIAERPAEDPVQQDKPATEAAKRRRWRWLLLVLAYGIFWWFIYFRTHPLVFMKTHAHCIQIAALGLEGYAIQHEGRFPSHPKGYANALLLLDEECFHALTGPGYDAVPLHQAKRTGSDLPEAKCGRVYVQGLTKKSNPELALLFDKLPTPGGDHCPLPYRLWTPLGREVVFVGGDHRFVLESTWPQFARNQVELLVQEGMDRQEAERLFASNRE